MSSKNLTILFLTLQIILVFAQGDLYKLNLISQQGGASCLDGSVPGYYIHQGFGSNRHNYLIYFSGGGFCGQPTLSDTLQSCYKRSFTNLGSTKNASSTLNTTGKGILSTLQSQNQLFFDWTKIGVIYCDGSEYFGYRQSPISYKDRNLYFRGSMNVKQIFRHLNQKYNIYDGDNIIITGVSAGGIASFQWSNYLFDNTKKAKVYSMPDSGLFITDYYSQVVGKKMLRQYAGPLLNLVYNKTQVPDPIQKCLLEESFDVVDCFNAANYAKHLKAPIFMIQSPYDQWCLRYIIGAQCLTNPRAPFSIQTCNETVRKAIQDYRSKAIQYLKLIKKSRKDIGMWGLPCVQHGFTSYPSFDNSSYVVQQFTLMKAIETFLNRPNEAPWLLDQRSWPNNRGCSGLKNQYHLTSELF